MAKITIFGLAGTGTSTTGRALAKKLGYQFISNGDFARAQAKELNMSINEFDELSKKDPVYDRDRDGMVQKFGQENDNFVGEGRLTWYFIPDSFKIKLDCVFEERVRRVAGRDHMDFEKAKELTLHREDALNHRFQEYYDIADYTDNAHFDLILDSTATPVTAIVEKIIEFVKERDLSTKLDK